MTCRLNIQYNPLKNATIPRWPDHVYLFNIARTKTLFLSNFIRMKYFATLKKLFIKLQFLKYELLIKNWQTHKYINTNLTCDTFFNYSSNKGKCSIIK